MSGIQNSVPFHYTTTTLFTQQYILDVLSLALDKFFFWNKIFKKHLNIYMQNTCESIHLKRKKYT